MKNKHCFYTSFNKAYAAQAMLLASSLRNVYQDSAHIVALVIDELDEEERDVLSAFDEILLAEDLGIKNFRSWIFAHSIVEAATAVKPFALCHLLTRFPRVTYLDPDTYVYSRLDEVTSTANKADVTLTPHQISPQKEEWLAQATELESLRFGVYNLGFLSVRATANGMRVAEWWAERCYANCIDDASRGLFTDQKFFDLAPALFDGVKVLRHPGYNVATWNLRERHMEFSDTGPEVNGQPLRFCHFTKATHRGSAALERMATDGNFFVELFHAYVARLRSKRAELASLDTEWRYGFYADDTPVTDDVRRAYRARIGGRRTGLANPFVSATATQAFLARTA